MINLFKRLIAPIFILFLSIGLLSASQQSIQKDPEQIAADMQKTQVKVEVTVPLRDGWDSTIQGSGTVVAKTNNVYLIHTNTHMLDDLEITLIHYKEGRIRICILGKNGDEVRAEIVAWNWQVESLLLKAEVPPAQLENFKFEVAKASDRLPVSTEERKYSDNLIVDSVYAGGYPRGELADSCGKVTRYVENELIRTRFYSFRVLKTMHVAFNGLIGSGQSGGGIFMINEKTGKPEWVGATAFGIELDQLTIAIPIDVIVEEFLKQIPDLKGLIDFPSFILNPSLKNASRTVLYKDPQKDNN